MSRISLVLAPQPEGGYTITSPLEELERIRHANRPTPPRLI
jgi:hypothetical protein